jgi:hypothetical protein
MYMYVISSLHIPDGLTLIFYHELKEYMEFLSTTLTSSKWWGGYNWELNYLLPNHKLWKRRGKTTAIHTHIPSLCFC